MKKVLKAKSLTSFLTDEDIENKPGVTRFLSFESAISAFHKMYNIPDGILGYRVTNQGIEIIYN